MEKNILKYLFLTEHINGLYTKFCEAKEKGEDLSRLSKDIENIRNIMSELQAQILEKIGARTLH